MASASGACFVGRWKVMVGDDEVEAEATRSFSLGEGSHPGVDCDHEASALCVGCLKHRGLQSIAFAETVGDVEANRCRRAFQWRS